MIHALEITGIALACGIGGAFLFMWPAEKICGNGFFGPVEVGFWGLVGIIVGLISGVFFGSWLLG